jgi:NAD(P)-dependent dehydrogenase (short-subunit alcohol dehydrogenase family)
LIRASSSSSSSPTTQAAAFPISNYTFKEVKSAFRAVRTRWPNSDIRVAIYNAGSGIWKPFLQITEDEVNNVTDANVNAAFAFSREAITAFQGQSIDNSGGRGKRGTLLFTGATASPRGNTTTTAFSGANFALRSLSQSLNKEFGKENIHVSLCMPPLSGGFTFTVPPCAPHPLII